MSGDPPEKEAPPGQKDQDDLSSIYRRKIPERKQDNPHVERLQTLLGPCVLLNVPRREKGCKTPNWQRLGVAQMTSYYLSKLNHDGNIGVSLGRVSGGLCTIDIDNDELFEELLELNPALRGSLISRSGSRGGNVWLRMKGEYSRSCKLRIDGEDVGEWRANGNQTVIYGQHASGNEYLDNGKRPIEIEFSEIRWPERMTLPWLKKAAQSKGSGRPGVSDEFLRERGVRHVEADEAGALLGSVPRGGGLWIPYFTLDGAGPLMVKGREYGRLRLDTPSGDVKYLSPKESGAHLYVPKNFEFSGGKEVVVCEGEFKALGLCEAGISAVAIGGVSSAMPGGDLLPDLKKLLSKFTAIEKVCFLGDADTAFNFEFSREAVKLAGALPEGVSLRLPRIPIGGPNGIDDCRAEFGGGFLEFWEGIKVGAIEVIAESEPGTIAAELLARELPAIGKLPDWKKKYQAKILSLAGRLEPVALDEVCRMAKEHLGISMGAFKDGAARTAKRLLPSIPIVPPEIYFDGTNYFRRNKDMSGFESIGREDVMLELRKSGFPHRTAKGTETSPCEDALSCLQKVNRVDYAGPFCGRPPGLYREKEVTVLCTQGPKIIEGVQGDAGPMKDFLESLLGKGRDPFFEEQRLTLYGWLQRARIALRHYDQHLPGQILALIGPPDCGKSLSQWIITQFLGGRQFDPSGYLVKTQQFNLEMWRAEHEMLGDEEPVGEGRGGVHAFRERLKKAAVAYEYPLHGKHLEGKSARPVWRITLSGNDDSEALIVLPSPTGSFADKIIYLQCHAPLKPYHDGSAEQSKAFLGRLMGALPAFLWEVDNLELPKEMRGSRFGVKEFHHPRVVELIDAASPVYALGEALVLEAGKQGVTGFEGTAVELYGKLKRNFEESPSSWTPV